MIKTIYIEEEIKDHERTKKILLKFKNVRKIFIEKYTEIFNKKNQNFRIQKINPSLILAKKRKNFVLKTPTGFGIGSTKNYYFSHMYNCIYDCRYCFLQGMYSSANFVLFVNYEDFFDKINALIHQNQKEKLTFFSGYDCDSLALEKITGFAEYAVSKINFNKNILFEFRTKSIQLEPFINSEPKKNIILAFSLLPKEISVNLDLTAPLIDKRINTMRKISEHGWQIGIRLDPLIYHEGWKKNYKNLIENICNTVNERNIHSISFGSIRFPKKMFKKIYSLYPDEKLFSNNLVHNDKLITLNHEIENAMFQFCKTLTKSKFNNTPIFSCVSY